MNIREFKCETCADKPEFDAPGKLMYHLQEVHQLRPVAGQPGIAGSRTAIMCMDGAGFYDNTFQWTFADGAVSVIEHQHGGRLG